MTTAVAYPQLLHHLPGHDRRTGAVLIEVDPRYYRPTEVDLLLGDPTKAREKLGWRHTTTFLELAAEMVAADIAKLKGNGQPQLHVAHG